MPGWRGLIGVCRASSSRAIWLFIARAALPVFGW
jgi:hypothetical protein